MTDRANPPSAPDLLGRTLGQFRITARIGEGGMGVVYRAIDERLRRTVALKVLPDDSMKDEVRRRRFFREARSAAAVTHANVATIYEIGEADGQIFIAMELVEGTSLRELLRHGRLSLAESLRIMRAVAHALAKAHDKGIVHRDLKPENVMLNEDREVKVLDFGLAKLLDAPPESSAGEPPKETVTEETGTTLMGTPAYMSPEQAAGKPVDVRTDVWSFGVMLYELVTGQRPFGGTTSLETLVAIARDEPPAPTSIVPMPPSLDHVIQTCLRKKPSERYASGKDLLIAMEATESARALISDIGIQPTLDARSQSQPSVAGSSKDSHRSGSGSLDPGAFGHAKRVRTRVAVAVTGIAIGIAGGGWLARGHSHADDTAGAPPSAPLPPPKSPAQTLADDAAKKDVEGRRDLACAEYERASDLDPAFGQAALEAAFCHEDKPQVGRPYFRRAWAARATLDGFHAGMLDAFEAIYQRDPRDAPECIARLNKLAAKYPDEARVHRALASLYANLGQTQESRVEWDRSLGIDPTNPRALETVADNLAYSGDFEGAERDLARCLDGAHDALGCIEEGAWIAGENGQCAALEAAGRHMLAVEPTYAEGASFVASALLAQGSPVSAIREILRRQRESLPEDKRAAAERTDEIRLALVQGDLPTAAARAQEAYDAVKDSPVAVDHGRAARILATIDEESGARAEAGRIAADYLSGRDAWEPTARLEDWAMADEPTPRFLAMKLRAGLSSPAEFERDRARTVERWDARVERITRNFVWVYAFAVPTATKDDATTALASLPSYEPIPRFAPLSLVSADIGRTLFLGGRIDDAIPWLERATHNCFTLDHAIEQARAFYVLGQAREAKGDTPGACAAYGVVRERWGSASPAPVTAQRSAARRAALHCPK